jgi:hypothetical protein
MLKRRLGDLGYIKQSKHFSNYFIKKTDQGNHGITCQIDARYHISLSLSFGLRFDAVARIMDLLDEEIARRGRCGVHLDPEEEKYYRSIACNFVCLYERLAGLPDLTADTIESEVELEPLCERTLLRVHEHGIPFFAKYGTLDAVIRVIETDSPEWRFLEQLRGDFLVTAAASMLAVRGPNAMVEYLKNHDADPKLIGWDRERSEMLIAVSERERKKR